MPASLRPATLDEHDLEPESTFQTLAFSDLALDGRDAESVEFSACRFTKTRLSGSQLNRVRLVDCQVDACDWSNLRTEGGSTDRVSFTASRLTGLAWVDGLVRDARFQECKLDLSSWRFTHFDAATFVDCNLTGADFTNADLGGASFERCNLTGAQFSNATMQGARFRRCELQGIGGVTSWSGAIVHRDDLMELSYSLAGALVIRVEGDDE